MNQPVGEIWIECSCGAVAPLPAASADEPVCGACGESIAPQVSILMDAIAAAAAGRPLCANAQEPFFVR